MDTLRPLPPTDITALDDWLLAQEAAYPDIRPGNAKGIVWNASSRARAPWAVVYLHGFSASRQETAPLSEQVARALGGHVFYTRLTGHGRTGDALAQASEQDWMADVSEALHIGRTLGERVLLIACSTGATLATRLATSADADLVSAHVFISPNFGLRDPRAALLLHRWSRWLALAIQGQTRSWQPANPREANAWTTRYPTKALVPMLALVQRVQTSDLSSFLRPVLVLYSQRDQTVDPGAIRAAFQRLGAHQKTLHAVHNSTSQGQHVLAGDITAPETVAPMAHTIVQWVHALAPVPD